ncbi:hypothetical protein C6P41_000551 [Kluyveromyces marxianus]|nr:hypothetical protein C6P41_000551 [Kluyveromyces marxianus]
MINQIVLSFIAISGVANAQAGPFANTTLGFGSPSGSNSSIYSVPASASAPAPYLNSTRSVLQTETFAPTTLPKKKSSTTYALTTSSSSSSSTVSAPQESFAPTTSPADDAAAAES